PNKTSLSSVRQKFDRCTDKGVVMFSTLRFSVPWARSLHDDFPDHVRMQTTKVVEGAGAGERIGKRIVSIERLRPEHLVLVDHRMRYIVVVDPLHRRSRGNRQFLGSEREVVDGDHVRRVLRRYRTKSQHRADDRAQKQRNDQT